MLSKFIKKFRFLFLLSCCFSETNIYIPEAIQKIINNNYINNNLEPINIYTRENTVTIIYENKQSIEFYKKYAWYGNFICESNFKEMFWDYILIFKNHKPPKNISKLIINSETQLDILYSYNPVMVQETKNSENLNNITFVYILENEDIIFLTVEKTFSLVINPKTKQSKKFYKYFIKNIEIKNKQNIFDTLKYLNNYSIGTEVSSRILEKLKEISLIVPIKNTNHKYYYINFSLPHDYSACTEPHEIEESKNILYIFLLNEKNIIENIIYKPYCCLKK